MDAHV